MVRGAITSGELDIYPEYTAMGRSSLKMKTMQRGKRAARLRESQKLDAEQNKLIWLTPAPANNTWTIAVRQDVAEKTSSLRLPT